MKLTRYTDTAPVDYMILDKDGDWVPASEALEMQARLEKELSRTERLRKMAEAWSDSDDVADCDMVSMDLLAVLNS